MLSITGEDGMDINRKNSKYWNGQLTTRLVVIFSNELLRFQDDSGALAGRFLTWRMQQSFRDRADPYLTSKLLAERAGIFNLALSALDALRARGHLEQCESGVEMSDRLGAITSDVSVFVEECCVVSAAQEIMVEELFERWKWWCEAKGIRHGWGTPQFSEKVRSAVPTLRSSRTRVGNPDRLTKLFGIGLRRRFDKLGRLIEA
jgi:putative DNA primase/helicase